MGVNNECRQAIELLAETLFPNTHEKMDGTDVAHAVLRRVAELEGKLRETRFELIHAKDRHMTLERETKWADGELRVGGWLVPLRFRGILHVSSHVKIDEGEPEPDAGETEGE